MALITKNDVPVTQVLRNPRRASQKMKPTDLETKMHPGALSEGGFLGPSESLDSVMKNDETTLALLGISCRNLADALEAILSAALERYPEHSGSFTVGVYSVSLQVWRGFQDCPWGCQVDVCAKLGFVDFTIINTLSEETIAGPGLITHLIRDHHFFEGKHSPYRVEPEKLARVLGIVDPKDAAAR
jgi:hypothetical protein